MKLIDFEIDFLKAFKFQLPEHIEDNYFINGFKKYSIQHNIIIYSIVQYNSYIINKIFHNTVL